MIDRLLGDGPLLLGGVGRRQRRNPWAGATWAVSGGNAYNVPTLGSELLTNGDMELDSSWFNFVTPTANERSSAQVRSGYSRRWVSDVIGDGILSANFSMSAFVWYHLEGWLYAASLAITVARNNGAVADFTQTITPISTWTPIRMGVRAISSGSNAIRIQASTAGAANEHFADDFSVKAISLPSLFATIAGASSTQTAAAKIAALTTSTQAGVVSLLDSASSPANFLIAYHDGSTVKLDKCVAGTYTNLVSVTVAFSANAQIEIRRPSGNTFQLWYSGTQRGTDQTVADAGIISNTRYGLFSTHTNEFSEFSLGGVVIPFQFPGA
jgi:hypothetical protein